MRTQTWEQMADWYNQKQGDEGDLWHRALIDPVLFKIVGNASKQRVLDLACGNGYIARRLAKSGATVTGVDGSARMIEHAQAKETEQPLGIAYHVADAAHLKVLQDATFDVVVCNMSLMDIEDAEGTILEVSRVLRSKGRFVASLPHPCFEVGNSSAWVIEEVGRVRVTTTVWRKVSRYREPFRDEAGWRVTPNDVRYTIAYHRPLSWYFRALHKARLAVTSLEEPAPTEEFMKQSPEGPWISQIPLHCVIEARKLRN